MTSWFKIKKKTIQGLGWACCFKFKPIQKQTFCGRVLSGRPWSVMSCAVTVMQMVFPHVPFIMLCTVVTFGWDRPIYFQLPATVGVCGLKVVTGQRIWLLRAGSKCAAPIAGNERLPWALSSTEEVTGHLGLCPFPRSVSEICIKANQAERGGGFGNKVPLHSSPRVNLRLTKQNGMLKCYFSVKLLTSFPLHYTIKRLQNLPLFLLVAMSYCMLHSPTLCKTYSTSGFWQWCV